MEDKKEGEEEERTEVRTQKKEKQEGGDEYQETPNEMTNDKNNVEVLYNIGYHPQLEHGKVSMDVYLPTGRKRKEDDPAVTTKCTYFDKLPSLFFFKN